MTWDALADATLKVCIDTFKTVAEYQPTRGGPYTLCGVFDQKHEAVDPSTGAIVSTVQPTFGVRLKDMQAAPQQGDRIVIKNKKYKVYDSQPDGQGGAVLFLHHDTR